MNYFEFKTKYAREDYFERIEFLKEKYGEVPFAYFSTKECRSSSARNKNHKLYKSNFLNVHHIQEIDYDLLCSRHIAPELPWELQENYNLVYCDPFEHLMLHFIIYALRDDLGVSTPLYHMTYDLFFNKNIVQQYALNKRDWLKQHYGIDFINWFKKEVENQSKQYKSFNNPTTQRLYWIGKDVE